MPSPFPGMNPWLESPGVFHDFHQSYVPALRDALVVLAGPRYIVRLDSDIYIREWPEEDRRLLGYPDVYLASQAGGAWSGAGTGGPVTAVEPEQVSLVQFEDETNTFIEIRDRNNEDVITVVELLSPTNKRPGEGRDHYKHKRNQLLDSKTHLVEIDLLRGYPPMPMEPQRRTDYRVFVSRAEERPTAQVWRFDLRDTIPQIRVPVRVGDADLVLDLQTALHGVYDRAGYGHYIYDRPPEPPLAPADAAWAAELLSRHRAAN